MNIHESGIFRQDHMSAVSIAQSLEKMERKRGLTIGEARRSISNKVRCGIGTLENIIRERVKRVDERIRDRLQALLVRELEQEIMRLQNELEIARQGGAPLNSDQISEVETHLAKAREALNRGAQ